MVVMSVEADQTANSSHVQATKQQRLHVKKQTAVLFSYYKGGIGNQRDLFLNNQRDEKTSVIPLYIIAFGTRISLYYQKSQTSHR